MEIRRHLVQVCAALLYNVNYFTTSQKFRTRGCVPGLNCMYCAGAVGGCPLGRLQEVLAGGLQRVPLWVAGGLGGVALAGLLLGRLICGFLCPFGLLQDLLYKIPSPKFKRGRATRALSFLRYFIALFFVIVVPLYFAMAENARLYAFCNYVCANGWLVSFFEEAASPRGLTLLVSAEAAAVLAFLLACVAVFRPFCRFICPLGAFYGLFNKISLFGVTADAKKCTNCGLCMKVCPSDCRRVGDRECVACGTCRAKCPVHAVKIGCRYR